MTTHSSMRAWKIPKTGEPGRLQSMGSQRVGLTLSLSLVFSVMRVDRQGFGLPGFVLCLPLATGRALTGSGVTRRVREGA